MNITDISVTALSQCRMTRVRRCRNCGSNVPTGMKFCTTCGSPVS